MLYMWSMLRHSVDFFFCSSVDVGYVELVLHAVSKGVF